jgi:hypothetical protein
MDGNGGSCGRGLGALGLGGFAKPTFVGIGENCRGRDDEAADDLNRLDPFSRRSCRYQDADLRSGGG